MLLDCAPYAGRLRLGPDGSGVGRAEVDLLRREPIWGLVPTPVTITAGEQHSPPIPDAFNYWPVPKIALVRHLYQVIEGRRITVVPPGLPGADDLRGGRFSKGRGCGGGVATGDGDHARGWLDRAVC